MTCTNECADVVMNKAKSRKHAQPDGNVVHWIISPLEKQIKPKPVKEKEAGKEGDRHGTADEEAAKKWFMQIGIINM